MKLDAEELKNRIAPLFEENFTRFGELGAAVSIWQNGKPVVDLCGGFRDARHEHPWTSDSIVLVWSATKGIGSECVLHVLQENKVDFNQLVVELWPRVATMYPAKGSQPPEPKQFYVDLITPGTLARKAFTSPYGLHAVSAMNDISIRAQPIVSFGGIGSASSLAKFYAMLANGGKWEDRQFFSHETLRRMTTTLADGIDRVFQIPTAFSAGFMKDSQQ